MSRAKQYTEEDLVRRLENAPKKMSFASDKARHSFNNVRLMNAGTHDWSVQIVENWARLMEAELSRGRKLNDVADDCYNVATISRSHSRYFKNWAKCCLIVHWKYGRELMSDEAKEQFPKERVENFYTSDTDVAKQRAEDELIR